MAVSGAFVLDSLALGSGEFISQLESAELSPNVVSSLLRAAGDPAPGMRTIGSISPVIPFETTQVATALGALSTGFAWQDLSASNTDLGFRAVVPNSDRTARASSAHKRFRAADGMLTWDGLRASSRGNAAAQMNVHTVYDGTNAPIVAAGSQALGGSPVANELFGLGKILINTTALGGEKDLSINLGLNVSKLSGASEEYDTLIYVSDYDVTIDISTAEYDEFEDVGPNGIAVTGFLAYLRKKAANGKYVADGTAEHISFASSSGILYFTGASGGGNAPAMGRLRLEITGALTVDTATAIT